ncbi:nuclear transport factor 2 family protein [Winogradskyella ursingii]|uniref:nuclear transport factor 2 family protein n=1 Tax=Winogradskyella ursingii TaxID=2686079 RepID=UPI0015C816D1|nr:nuclear transport factor 2 family protein [Winogradskyella ursingii]
MKSILSIVLLSFCFLSFSQTSSDEELIKATLNNYIEGFYQGDTLKLQSALKPKLYKFGYWKNKDTGAYEFSNQMTYDRAIAYAKNVLEKKQQKGSDVIRKIEILDVGNHIAAGKVTAWWGIDYMLLSKDNGKWMIEQVIWEGPLEKSHTN